MAPLALVLVSQKSLLYARAHGRWHQASIDKNMPEDFNDIGSVASPRGYIGFLFCHGTRLGALLQHLAQRDPSVASLKVSVAPYAKLYSSRLSSLPDLTPLASRARTPHSPL